MMERIGYARVSTDDQRLDLQLHALRKAGCEKIYEDHGVSGKDMGRSGLNLMLRTLRKGQTLVVWRLDRLGRNLIGLVSLINELGRRGIGLHSICEAIDTSSAGGRFMFHMIAALAEFERSLISERTRAGLNAARINGKRLGRPPALDEIQIAEALRGYSSGQTVTQLAEHYGVSPRTIDRIVRSGNGNEGSLA